MSETVYPQRLAHQEFVMQEESPSIRLFVALWPDAGVRQRLVACSRAQHWPAQARPVAPRDFHVTLQFLGDVPRSLLPPLEQALEAVRCEPFLLVFERLELWRKSLLVLCAAEVPAELEQLRMRLASVLSPLGLTCDEKVFRPHVTLARRADVFTPQPLPNPIHWQASGFCLVASQPPGPYRILQRYRWA